MDLALWMFVSLVNRFRSLTINLYRQYILPPVAQLRFLAQKHLAGSDEPQAQIQTCIDFLIYQGPISDAEKTLPRCRSS